MRSLIFQLHVGILIAQVGKLESNQFSRQRVKPPKKNAFVERLTENILFIFNETVSETVLREEDSNH